MPGAVTHPLSLSGLNLNSSQETGGLALRSSANIPGMKTTFLPRSVRSTQWRFILGKIFVGLALLTTIWIIGSAYPQAAVVATPRVTFVVFADRHMADDQWSALFRSLRQDFADLAVETHSLPANVDLVRGSEVKPGIQVELAVSVYLHGDCAILPQAGPHVVRGALGWVLRDHGQIQPFIHVDCARIGEIVGQHAMGMSPERRSEAIAKAISRVIMHEWIHVATGSAAHASEGISKGSFGFADLVPDEVRGAGQAGRGK